jgi:excisionase family DNA binding protein
MVDLMTTHMNSKSLERRWLNLEELLQKLPLKKSHVYYLVHTNQIPHHRIGRTLIFDYDEIINWVEDNGSRARLSPQAS